MPPIAKQHSEHAKPLPYILICIFFVGAASAVGELFRSLNFPETNIVIVYLLSVVLTARLTRGYIYGIAAAVLATVAFNYIFTHPYYTLSVSDPSYVITFAIMMLAAVITGALTTKAMKKAQEAQEKEAEASALYHLMNRLTDAVNIGDIASISVKAISESLGCRAACLCFDESGRPEKTYIQQKSPERQIQREVEEGDALRAKMERLISSCDMGDEFYDWPIRGRDAVLGVMRIPRASAAAMNDAQRRLLRSMIESTSLAMDRFRSAQQRIRSQEEVTQERYRGNLLRAISHDLRTPLSGIMGTSEMLMGMTERSDSRYALAEEIYQDADWLHSLVENILNLTRLQDGKLMLDKQMEAVEEIVGVAVFAIGKRAPEREIAVHIPQDLLMVPMDARLIEQVLVNLLDNAVKHTHPDQEISIWAREDTENGVVEFRVANRGESIAEEDLPRIFQMFYTTRSKGPDVQRGVGLGLTICESIIKAHGGTIRAHNLADGPGTEFIFTLPMEGKANGQ